MARGWIAGWLSNMMAHRPVEERAAARRRGGGDGRSLRRLRPGLLAVAAIGAIIVGVVAFVLLWRHLSAARG
jgi:hypothetical protein